MNANMYRTILSINCHSDTKLRWWMDKRVFFSKGFHLDLKYYVGNDQGYSSGAVTMVCGENGAGKTTLIKTIDPVALGNYGCSVTYFDAQTGIDLDYHKNFSKIKQSCIAVYPTFTENHIADIFSIDETLKMLDRYKCSYDKEYLFNLIEEFKLPMNRRLRDFSMGEAQLFSLFLGLARKPSVLLLDEPFSVLSVINREKISNILQEYVDSPGAKAILITSNHPEEDTKLINVDFFVLMDQLKICETLYPEDLLGNEKTISQAIAKAIICNRDIQKNRKGEK